MNPISPLVEEEEENECGAKRPGQHVSLPLFPSHTPTHSFTLTFSTKHDNINLNLNFLLFLQLSAHEP